MQNRPRHRSHQITVKTEAVSRHGMVTAMHPLAAEAGIEILDSEGGNAADAAIATALALGVVEPFMSGLGGCAYAVVHDASRRETRCFDGSATVPAAARPDMFELASPDRVSQGLYGWRATRGDASETGYLSLAVPGALAALGRLHAALATRPWKVLVAPALRLAREGFPVDEYLFGQCASSESRLRAFPETLAVFYHPDGTSRVPSFHAAAPERLHQPALADALEMLGREGPETFYRGEAAGEIVDFVRAQGAILNREDLAAYEAREVPPADIRYRGHRVQLLGGPSGGTTVGMALRLLDGFDLPSYPPDAPERLHLVAEALRIVFSERFRFMADPELERSPIDVLLSPGYAAERRRLMDPKGARLAEIPPGNPFAFGEEAPRERVEGAGDAPDQHTTHLNVVDRRRNMVSLTATLGARFGSGVTVPALGIVLNNGMMWFDPQPGRLSSIRPGKRALHAAAPCLVFREDRPLLALGSPGARRIMSAVLQVLLHAIDHRMGIQEAILAPRIHCEPQSPLTVDARFPSAVIEALEARGHRPEAMTESFLSSFFGRPSGIVIDEDAGELRGGVEPYRVSTAIGC